MPIVRKQVYDFVRLWNAHKIRPQKQRVNSVIGKPYMLYNHPGPGVSNWGVSYNEENYHSIKEQVSDWNIDAYLPPATHLWCEDFLRGIGFEHSRVRLHTETERERPLLHIYCLLRAAIHDHILNRRQPELSLLERPVGAYSWLGDMPGEAAVRTDGDLETDPIDSVDSEGAAAAAHKDR
jgi:hypothetical protein